MRLRPGRPEDFEAVRRVHRQAVRRLAAGAYDDRQVRAWTDWSEADGPTGGEDPDAHSLVAERDGEVVGFGRLTHGSADADGTGGTGGTDGTDRTGGTGGTGGSEGAEGAPAGEIVAVYVHPDHAREGVGTALLAGLEGYARGVGLAELTLSASLNAVDFYARAGYERVRRDVHETGGGVELDCVVMRKRL